MMKLDDLARRVAWMLPRSVVYWAAVRFWSHATVTGPGRQLPPDQMTWRLAVRLWHGYSDVVMKDCTFVTTGQGTLVETRTGRVEPR